MCNSVCLAGLVLNRDELDKLASQRSFFERRRPDNWLPDRLSDAEWPRRIDETYPSEGRARARVGGAAAPDDAGGRVSRTGLSNRPYWAVSRSQSVELTIRPASVHLKVSESRLLGEYDLGAGRSDKRRSKRSAIYEFSRRSRLKLQLMAADLAEVVGGPDLFITLTYPGEWRSVCIGHKDTEIVAVDLGSGSTAETLYVDKGKLRAGCGCGAGQGSSDVSSCICKPSGAVVKDKHLKAFRKFLGRYFSRRGGHDWGALWFFEFQTRGAPHIHVLPWGVGRVNVEALRKRVALAWSKIIAHKDDSERAKGLKAGTGVERARAKHFGYALKYAAKMSQKAVPDAWGSVGRFWGVWNNPVGAPVLRSFYVSANTCKRLADGVLAAIAEVASEGFYDKVSGLFHSKGAFSINLFGVGAVQFLKSYGVPSG